MTSLLADDARIPSAVATFQRAPEQPIKYRSFTRLSDWWAGRSDRRTLDRTFKRSPDRRDLPEQSVSLISTPWLQRLGHEASTRLEAERRGTLAVTAVIDDLLAGHRRHINNAQAEIDRLQGERDTLTAEPSSDQPTTAAETYESPQQLLLRRQREHHARLARLQARTTALHADIDQTRADIDTLTAARHSHWTLLLVRSQHLLAHYNRRSATYTRALIRHMPAPPTTPTVDGPPWTRQPTDPNQLPAEPHRPEHDRPEHDRPEHDSERNPSRYPGEETP